MKASINEITIIVVLYEEKTSLIFQCLENIKNYEIENIIQTINKILYKI